VLRCLRKTTEVIRITWNSTTGEEGAASRRGKWQDKESVGKRKERRFLFSAVALVLLLGVRFPAWGLAGIETVPQSPLFHAASLPDEPLISAERHAELYRRMKEQFYSPWRQDAPRQASETLQWVFDRYGKGGIYGENLQPRPASWVDEQRGQARLDAVGELNARCVSVRPTSLRLMPTETPVFLSPDLPGEGYPFDYLQNSLVHPGEPLFASHLSLDGLWAWCDTSYASGWVSISDLAFVDEADIQRWRSMPLAAITREHAILRDGTTSLFRAKIGTLLPLARRGIAVHTLIAPARGGDGRLSERLVRVAADEASPMPLSPTPWTLAAIAEECLGELYGWGGFLGNRDCSAMTRDILLPFGIWLPRNSRFQGETGKVVPLDGLSGEEKKELIRSGGVPFLTLIGMPGHVMLYVGTRRGEPVVLHNLWGIRTERKGKEGRFVVGESVLTTLDLGSDLPDHAPGRLLIDRIHRMALPADEGVQ